MISKNRVDLIGFLGQDPTLYEFPDGGIKARVTLATNYVTKDGKKYTEWHNLVLHDALAERAKQYWHKGLLINVEGRIQTRRYKKDGVDHFITEIVVHYSLILERQQRSAEDEPVTPSPEIPAIPADAEFPTAEEVVA